MDKKLMVVREKGEVDMIEDRGEEVGVETLLKDDHH
jgi:hypothetical protein